MRTLRRGGDDQPFWTVAKLLVLVLALVASALLLWRLAHVFLLLFAAILVAVLLRSTASLFERISPLTGRWAVGLACLLIGAILAGFVWLLGSQVRAQATALAESLPDLIDAAEDWLGIEGFGDWLRGRVDEVLEDSAIATSVAGYSTWVFSIAAHALIVVASGVYLALHPQLYLSGLLKLIPEERQDEARETLQAVGRALKLWLIGQLAAMAMVGVLTTLGLWLLGVPTPLALGVLAALLEFVPFIGPLLSALPAVAVALADSPTMAVWVVILYIAIQQIEGMLITPLVQQHTVDLPPVVTIFAIIAFGVLFGSLGVLLATPLAVVCMVLVKKLWVREVLEEEVELPGEAEEEAEAQAEATK